MKSGAYLRAFSEFFLDGAKIVFGSVVVGAFVPGTTGAVSWFIFFVGVLATAFFLIISAVITNINKARTQNT